MYDLTNYLERHSDNNETDFRHRQLLDDILSQFYSLTGELITSSYREVKMRDDGTLVGVVDLVIINQSDEVYLIEGKVVRSKSKDMKKIKADITHQLRAAYSFFNEKFEVKPRLLGVYKPSRSDRLKVIEIRPLIES